MQQAQLDIDGEAGTIRLDGQLLPLGPESLLFQALSLLAQAGREGLGKEELFPALWGESYHCQDKSQRVYMTIRRLRKWIPIELSRGRYRLPAGLDCTVSTHGPQAPIALSARLGRVLALLRECPKLERRTVATRFSVSPRTALRDLTELAELGHVERVGKGRAAHYVARESIR